MYANLAAMLAAFGEVELVSLTDRKYTGEIDEAVLNEALTRAGDEINGYLGGRYVLPLDPAPRILSGYACDIARYRLCGAESPVTEEIRTRYKDAIRFLELVAAGKITLGGMPDGGVAEPGDTVDFVAGPKIFGRDGGAY